MPYLKTIPFSGTVRKHENAECTASLESIKLFVQRQMSVNSVKNLMFLNIFFTNNGVLDTVTFLHTLF